jgi:TDG/mug DNA glycosylase family protein
MAFVTFYLSVGQHALDKAGAPARQPLSIGRQPGRCPIASGRPPAAHKEETGLSSYEPDILARDLDVIFCGVNPATTAAVVGHNFSSCSNRFWTVLHLTGFTDVRLQPHEERRLLEYRCGLTAVVARPTRRAIDVPPDEFRKARPGFEAKIRRYAPRSVAFLGKRTFSAMMDQPNVAWGRYPAGFAGTTTWILPNPSGLNKAFSLEALVRTIASCGRPSGPGRQRETSGHGERPGRIDSARSRRGNLDLSWRVPSTTGAIRMRLRRNRPLW